MSLLINSIEDALTLNIPWVKTGDLPDGLITEIDESITPEGLINSSAKLFPEGSLVVAMYGATIGKLGVLTKPATTNQACAVLIAQDTSKEIIPCLFYYLLANREKLKSIGQGGAQPNISQAILKEFPYPLAPLNEQRRIVAKIEALMERSRRAKAFLDVVPQLLELFRQSVLAAAFKGDLTEDWRENNPNVETVEDLLFRTPAPPQPRGGREATTKLIPGRCALSVNNPDTALPVGWSWVSLLRVSRQETGHTPSKKVGSYWGGSIPWIGIKDASEHHGEVIHDTFQHVTQDGLANSAARLLPAGTVCLSRTASVGYVVIMGQEMATSQDFVTWTCTTALEPKYLMYALLAEGKDIRNFGEGTTHTTIYFPEIRALHIALSPLKEQREIISKIEIQFDSIRKLSDKLVSGYNLLSQLEKAVLSEAFRGELVVAQKVGVEKKAATC